MGRIDKVRRKCILVGERMLSEPPVKKWHGIWEREKINQVAWTREEETNKINRYY